MKQRSKEVTTEEAASRRVPKWEEYPHTPVFFVTAHSKGVAGENRGTAHSKRLKVAVFSMSWEWLVSAYSKGFAGTFCILIGISLGTAHSKEVRRTTWWQRMVRRARKIAPTQQNFYSTSVQSVNSYLQVVWML